MPTSIFIDTKDASLHATLAPQARALEIVTSLDESDVAFVDYDVDASQRVVFRITDQPEASRDGSISISLQSVLADPGGVLAMATALAEQRLLLAVARDEVEFARNLRELMSLGDLSTVFRRVSETATELSGAFCATLLLHDPVVERFSVAYSNDPDVKEEGDYLPGIPPDTLQQAITGTTQYAIRTATAARGGQLVVPLRIGEDLLGVVTLSHPRGQDFATALAEKAAGYILAIGPFLVTVHQLSRSRDLALRDDLTKAFNRRFFDAHLDEEIERARRYNSLVSVIFLDLDDLKLINNLYGHLSGSRMLQEVARRILGAVRAIDKVVRFGGDEFCIVLPQTDPEQARAVANRVRRAMGERKFHLDPDIDIAMTASFGIATYPVHAQTKEDLIRAADAAMYKVKSSSKNAIDTAPVSADEAIAARAVVSDHGTAH